MAGLGESIKSAGGFGKFQILFTFNASLFMILTAANMGASIFEAMVPEMNCEHPYGNEIREACPDEYKNLATPTDENRQPSVCLRYSTEYLNLTWQKINATNFNCSEQINETAADVVPCREWTYDKSIMRNTIVTEFDLVCGYEWAGYIAQSALMTGVGIGSVIAGYISDRLGRRMAMLIISLCAAVIGSVLSFTKSYLSYSIIRAIVGIFVYAPFLVLFVHTSEWTVPKYRSTVAQIMQMSFPSGFAFLSLVSYLLRDWRSIQLAISAPFLLGCLFWLVPESPRWLLMKGRNDEATAAIVKVARLNQGKDLPIRDVTLANSSKDNEKDDKDAFKLIFKKGNIRSASLRMFYNWFAVSCVYYGLTLNAAELGGDPFTNLLINAGAESVAVLLTIVFVNVLGRRTTGSLSEIIAGILCVLIQVLPKDAVFVLANLGKFAISVAFSTMFITASEIFPTQIRNSGTGLCSAMARLGGVVSPLIAMTATWSPATPYVIFGSLSALGGFVILTLPETNGVALPQTIEEGENFIADDPGVLARIPRLRIYRAK